MISKSGATPCRGVPDFDERYSMVGLNGSPENNSTSQLYQSFLLDRSCRNTDSVKNRGDNLFRQGVVT